MKIVINESQYKLFEMKHILENLILEDDDSSTLNYYKKTLSDYIWLGVSPESLKSQVDKTDFQDKNGIKLYIEKEYEKYKKTVKTNITNQSASSNQSVVANTEKQNASSNNKQSQSANQSVVANTEKKSNSNNQSVVTNTEKKSASSSNDKQSSSANIEKKGASVSNDKQSSSNQNTAQVNNTDKKDGVNKDDKVKSSISEAALQAWRYVFQHKPTGLRSSLCTRGVYYLVKTFTKGCTRTSIQNDNGKTWENIGHLNAWSDSTLDNHAFINKLCESLDNGGFGYYIKYKENHICEEPEEAINYFKNKIDTSEPGDVVVYYTSFPDGNVRKDRKTNGISTYGHAQFCYAKNKFASDRMYNYGTNFVYKRVIRGNVKRDPNRKNEKGKTWWLVILSPTKFTNGQDTVSLHAKSNNL